MSADERRGKLVEAAITVMTRDGVAKATTRAIVAEAEMPLGVFHYCFRSKQELLENVIEAIQAHSLERVAEIAEPRATIEETLRTTVAAYWGHVVSNPEEHRLTYELTQFALRQEGFEGLARKQYEFYLATLTSFLDATSEKLAIDWAIEPDSLARYLFSVLDGLTLNWVILGDQDVAAAESVLDVACTHLASLARHGADDGTC